MPSTPDFEALYSQEPGKIRSNANLPGQLVMPVSRLTMHANNLEEFRKAIEKSTPGYEPDHRHEPECKVRVAITGIETECKKWNWKDWNIPENFNPVREFILPYLQLSRAEAMKGSEQVVRSFQGGRPSDIEGVGTAPDLAPRPRATAQTATLVVMAQNGHAGLQEAKKEASLAKRMIGLGGKK